ncbi:MAG: bis(5'-nucleosyl)-tetraphosphatase (symmetrical) YqeK [Elusimicrobiota bacterium]
MTETDIRRRLSAELSPARLRHTLSVARLAAKLARRHKLDPGRARLAGLLHDCAKEFPGRRLADIARRNRLPVPGMDFILRRKQYGLLHAHVSAWRAAGEFGVRDNAVLRAVERHTLGAAPMSPFDKLLFVADFAAPQRAYAAAAEVRRLALRDLNAAFRETLRHKLMFVLRRGGALHPAAVELWNGEMESGKRRMKRHG